MFKDRRRAGRERARGGKETVREGGRNVSIDKKEHDEVKKKK